MYIEYKEIDNSFLEKISVKYGETAKNHIHLENGSFSLAALHDGVPVGFISTYTKMLTPPLNDAKDAYIDIIEVDTPYRRKGIARQLILLTERWAAKNGFSQIRVWSSQDKIEAIPMWQALQYSMCPATIWLEWCKQIVDGYYVAKQLQPLNSEYKKAKEDFIVLDKYDLEQWALLGNFDAASHYDENHGIGEGDIKFLLSVIGNEQKNILEVCCGTGRLFIPCL